MKRISFYCLLFLLIGSLAATALDDNRPTRSGPRTLPEQKATTPQTVFLAPGSKITYDSEPAANDLEQAIRDLEEQLYVRSEALSNSERDYLTQRLNDLHGRRPQNQRSGHSLDQAGDNCSTITVIGAIPYHDSGTTAGLTNNWNTASSCATGGVSNAPDVIYRFTPSATGTFRISTCGSWFNTLLEVRTGGSCPGTTQVACGEDGCGTHAELVLSLTGSQIYYIILDGSGTSSGEYNFRLEGMCNIYRHAGDLTECGETIDSSHARLDCDGGTCNTDWGGTTRYEDIQSGETWFGRIFTYTDPLGNAARDVDWYRFTIHESCTLNVKIAAECPIIYSLRTMSDCSTYTYWMTHGTCDTTNFFMLHAEPNDYEIYIKPWGMTGLPSARDYRLTLNITPAGGCVVDNWMTAPGTVSGNTCGEADHCDSRPGPEHMVRVTIPEADDWTFSLCNSSTPHWGAITPLYSGCCDGSPYMAWSVHCPERSLPTIPCYHLEPGEYYLNIQGYEPDSCGAYQLEVFRCRTRCCYGGNYEGCLDLSKTACEIISGVHDDFNTCLADPCPAIPKCMEDAEYSQRPRGVDDSEFSSGYSDLDTPYLLYESFSGLSSPIFSLRFWGTMFNYGTTISAQRTPCPSTFASTRTMTGRRVPWSGVIIPLSAAFLVKRTFITARSMSIISCLRQL